MEIVYFVFMLFLISIGLIVECVIDLMLVLFSFKIRFGCCLYGLWSVLLKVLILENECKIF